MNLQGEAHIWKMMFAFADSMALKCAVDLGLADIINTHGCPITLQQLADGIICKSQDKNCLFRIMRVLVHKGIFTAEATMADTEETVNVYGLTPAAKWLLRDAKLSLAPMIRVETSELLMAPWHYFSKCVTEGGDAFPKAHQGLGIWECASKQPEFNADFNLAMACTSRIAVEAILSNYKNGFEGVGSVVDVGGGTGTLLMEIVKAHPHVHGINFDLPHVIKSAPDLTGIEHVGGDMFVEIPTADAIILKESKIAEVAEMNLQGEAHIWKMMFAFADSMALKCAVDLGLADIINTHGCPITLQQLADGIICKSQDKNCLFRIMRVLVHKGIFTAEATMADTEETVNVYGLTPAAKWLLRDAKLSLAPMIRVETSELLMAPWHYFSKCVTEGGDAFPKAHQGLGIWECASKQPEFNADFNLAMACTSRIAVEAILSNYKNGFEGVGSVVDVGGGTGTLLMEIVKAHPHVHGINFDLPHVIKSAPDLTGIEHVGGDMFVEIPTADAIILKWILHDWSDMDSLKILKNCHTVVAKNGGKIIIVDLVLNPEGRGIFDDTRLCFDLLMMAHTSGGKERTETEWIKLLSGGGFPRYKIIHLPSLFSIIEAYPA